MLGEASRTPSGPLKYTEFPLPGAMEGTALPLGGSTFAALVPCEHGGQWGIYM